MSASTTSPLRNVGRTVGGLIPCFSPNLCSLPSASPWQFQLAASPPSHSLTVPYPAAISTEDQVFLETLRDSSDLVYVCSPEMCTALQPGSIHRDYLAQPGDLLPEDVSNFALQIAEGMRHLEGLNVSSANGMSTCVCITWKPTCNGIQF